ncbi:MAG TPA: Rrf2 family transcriptional regulator [Magnetospirillaceae bacterium]|nr:Rrf2 family transcriptional regulator [Magnetospirillaceae bacterium]
MLRPSKKMLYAIEAVLDIAYHAGGEPVQSREITRRQGIPKRYLEQTLQQLVRAGLLTGVRGPRGGYRLARERRRISVGEIVRVVQALEAGEDNQDDLPSSALGLQVIHPMWNGLQEEIMARLDQITIDELCMNAHRSGIMSEVAQKMDFTI